MRTIILAALAVIFGLTSAFLFDFTAMHTTGVTLAIIAGGFALNAFGGALGIGIKWITKR